LWHAINRELKFSFNDKGALLMYVLVPGHGAASFNLYKIYRIGFCVDQFREKTKGDLFGLNIAETMKY